MQIDFRQFSKNNLYLSIPEKLSEIHLNAWLFSNPCGNVLLIVGISWSPDLRVQHIQWSYSGNMLTMTVNVFTSLSFGNSPYDIKEHLIFFFTNSIAYCKPFSLNPSSVADSVGGAVMTGGKV